MASPSQEFSQYKQDKLLRDAELIAKRQPWIILATAVAFVIALIATGLAGYALSVRDSASNVNVLKVVSNSQVGNDQGDYGRHPNDTEVALIAQRTGDLEAKINATNALLTNLHDQLDVLKKHVSDMNALASQTTCSTIEPKPTQTTGTSSSSSSSKARNYLVAVGFLVLLMHLC